MLVKRSSGVLPRVLIAAKDPHPSPAGADPVAPGAGAGSGAEEKTQELH